MISSAKLPRGGGRKNLEDMTPEEKAEADLTDLRCLSIFIATLELMHGVRASSYLIFVWTFVS